MFLNGQNSRIWKSNFSNSYVFENFNEVFYHISSLSAFFWFILIFQFLYFLPYCS